MINYSSVDSLSRRILALMKESFNDHILILVGGCSRTGKTNLVSKLTAKINSSGANTKIVGLDSWLISVDRRKKDSTVLERYDISSINSSLKKLQEGEPIYPPVYDAVSRKRIAESGKESITLKNGILFVEGVVALAIEELIESAALRVFVDIPDKLRVQRLVDFYSDIKKLDKKEYEMIIASREREEVPFIKKTVDNADVVFDGLELKV